MKLLKFADILSQGTSLFMYKLKYSMLPDTFYDSFRLNSDYHTINTRKKDDFRLPKFANSFLQNRSIRFQWSKKWNSLNNNLMGTSNYISFKNKLKSTILATYWYIEIMLNHSDYFFNVR